MEGGCRVCVGCVDVVGYVYVWGPPQNQLPPHSPLYTHMLYTSTHLILHTHLLYTRTFYTTHTHTWKTGFTQYQGALILHIKPCFNCLIKLYCIIILPLQLCS